MTDPAEESAQLHRILAEPIRVRICRMLNEQCIATGANDDFAGQRSGIALASDLLKKCHQPSVLHVRIRHDRPGR